MVVNWGFWGLKNLFGLAFLAKTPKFRGVFLAKTLGPLRGPYPGPTPVLAKNPSFFGIFRGFFDQKPLARYLFGSKRGHF